MSDAVIEVTNLTKQYKSHTVLKEVSFSIRPGMICGLVGPNGAGKTTIMKAIGGIILPTSGNISLFGETDEKGLAHSRSRMSFMIEDPYAKQNFSAVENLEKLRIQKGLPDKNRIKEVLGLVGLQNTGSKAVKKFSLGMKHRLGIAGAMLSKPEVMILDEPVNGLDPEGIIEIRELLLRLNREEHVTILISSHILSELSLLCTDYIFIKNGEIIRTLSEEELRTQCHEYYHIYSDNNSMIPAVLQNELGITNIAVQKDGSVNIFERTEDIRLISETLYKNRIIPVEIYMHDANLEEYYMNMQNENGSAKEGA